MYGYVCYIIVMYVMEYTVHYVFCITFASSLLSVTTHSYFLSWFLPGAILSDVGKLVLVSCTCTERARNLERRRRLKTLSNSPVLRDRGMIKISKIIVE